MERREGTEENAGELPMGRTLSRETMFGGLERVRQAAKGNKKMRFTALLHYIDVASLWMAYDRLKRNAAPGVDGVTWETYGENLIPNLTDLHERIHRGSYHPKPSRRKYIDKADGRKRPLGIAALEDKIVQGAVAEVLNAIYEEDFLGFSYGFRLGRGQHDALDALAVGITQRKVNFMLDADIAAFFDAMRHDWMERFLQHRIGDRRLLRLLRNKFANPLFLHRTPAPQSAGLGS